MARSCHLVMCEFQLAVPHSLEITSWQPRAIPCTDLMPVAGQAVVFWLSRNGLPRPGAARHIVT